MPGRGLSQTKRSIAELPSGQARVFGVKTENNLFRYRKKSRPAMIQAHRVLGFAHSGESVLKML